MIMYVCVYLFYMCMYVSTCIRIYIYMYIQYIHRDFHKWGKMEHMCIYIYRICLYANEMQMSILYIYIRMYVSIYIYIDMYVSVNVYMYI